MDEIGTPDWLSDLGPKPVDQSTIEDVPDWLHPSSNRTGPRRNPQAPQEFFGRNRVRRLTCLIGWPASITSRPLPQPETSSGDVPAWLQSEAEPEPQVTEPAHPADWQPIRTRKIFRSNLPVAEEKLHLRLPLEPMEPGSNT